MVNRNLTGDFLMLGGCETQELSFAAEITQYAPPPLGAPKSAFVVSTISKSIAAVHALLAEPNERLQKLLDQAGALALKMRELQDTNSIDAPSSLAGTKTKNPVWFQLARPEVARHPLARLYIGLAFLHAHHQKKPLPKVFEQHIEDVIRASDIPSNGVEALLTGELPNLYIGEAWLNRLHKYWRFVNKHYSSSPPPPPTPEHRASSQILSAALNSTASSRAGASSHRQLSSSQFKKATDLTRQELDTGSLLGALGVITSVSPFSCDVAAALPIRTPERELVAPTFIDPLLGTLHTNWGIAINEPGEPKPGCIPSSYWQTTPLPKILAKTLEQKAIELPEATRLSDLFPSEDIPDSSDLIYASETEIAPSWARLQTSAGNYLRGIGMNTLLSAMCSGQLGLVPRSKFHYATVTFDEYASHLTQAYRLFGWGEPVQVQELQMAFGCRTMPTIEALMLHDAILRSAVTAHHPGPNSGFNQLIDHHNAFTLLIGWRLSILLALRASARIEISSGLDEQHDLWVDVHDKTTRADRGRQPVPLCQFARHCIAAYRSHCAALARRLDKVHAPATELKLRCTSISQRKNCRLLTYVTRDGHIKPLASIRFTKSTDPSYSLPQDVGRKVAENMLRHEGVPSSSIDAFLRHFTTGQQPLSSTSSSNLTTDCTRAAQAMDRIAWKLFKTQVFGLSRD